MPSLALIFHCIDIADGKVKGNVSSTAARLADKIKTKCLPSPFTVKDVYSKHGLKERQEVEAACNILIEENWVMMHRKPKPLTGRPPLPEYSITPAFM